MRVHFCIFDCLVDRKAWGVVVALVVFALMIVPIGGVECMAADDVASMSVDDALSILEGKPVTTASPAPEILGPEEPLPMLRSASGGISTPYVSIFDQINVFTGTKDHTNQYTTYTSQPFSANIFDCYRDYYGDIDIKSGVLFYESLDYSGPCDYFRVHLSIENSLVTFNPCSGGLSTCNLFFVSNEGFGLSCRLSYDNDSGDFYCKVPVSYFASDGYFYLEFDGLFRMTDMQVSKYDCFTGLSVNDFIIPTTVLPSGVTLQDWVYVDRSKCRNFPDGSSPSVTPDPGSTGGGGGSTPATSDPALGEIKDSINSQKEQDAQQHEETKGLLGKIIDGITSIPSKIINMLTDALKALFVPSDDFLDKQLQAFGDSFDAMGFLGYPLSRSIDFLTGLSDAGSSDFTFAGYTFMSGGNFVIPSYSITIGGQSYKLWDNITWSFDGFFNYFPSEVKALLSMFIYLLGGLCVISYALHMARKYFGVILSDNVVLSVFGSLDNTVLDAMVDDLSEEDRYELDWWRRQEKARLDHMELEGFRKSHRRRRG